MLRQFEPSHTAGVSSIAIQNDTIMCVTSLDKTASLWDLRDGSRKATLTAHKDAVNGCLFLADGHRFLTCSDDRTVIVWDQRNLNEPHFVCTGFGEGVNKMCTSTDGTLLYSAVDSGVVFVHSIEQNLPLKYRFMASSGPVNDVVCFQPAPGAADILVTGCDGKALRTWKTGRIDDQPEGTEGEDRMLASLEAFEQSVNHVACRGDWVYAASAENILAVDINKETGEFGGEGRGYVGHGDWVRGLGFINNGTTLVSVADDKTAIEWSVEETTALAGAQLHDDNIMAMALTSDGTNLLTGCEDGSIRQWLVPFPRSVETQN